MSHRFAASRRQHFLEENNNNLNKPLVQPTSQEHMKRRQLKIWFHHLIYREEYDDRFPNEEHVLIDDKDMVDLLPMFEENYNLTNSQEKEMSIKRETNVYKRKNDRNLKDNQMDTLGRLNYFKNSVRRNFSKRKTNRKEQLYKSPTKCLFKENSSPEESVNSLKALTCSQMFSAVPGELDNLFDNFNNKNVTEEKFIGINEIKNNDFNYKLHSGIIDSSSPIDLMLLNQKKINKHIPNDIEAFENHEIDNNKAECIELAAFQNKREEAKSKKFNSRTSCKTMSFVENNYSKQNYKSSSLELENLSMKLKNEKKISPPFKNFFERPKTNMLKSATISDLPYWNSPLSPNFSTPSCFTKLSSSAHTSNVRSSSTEFKVFTIPTFRSRMKLGEITEKFKKGTINENAINKLIEADNKKETQNRDVTFKDPEFFLLKTPTFCEVSHKTSRSQSIVTPEALATKIKFDLNSSLLIYDKNTKKKYDNTSLIKKEQDNIKPILKAKENEKMQEEFENVKISDEMDLESFLENCNRQEEKCYQEEEMELSARFRKKQILKYNESLRKKKI